MALFSAGRLKLVFYLIVVPLIVLLYPALQTYRAHSVAQDEARILAHPNPGVRMKEELAMLQSEHASLHARSTLGPIGMAAALSAAWLGAAILLKIRRNSHAARQRLDILLTRYELNWRQLSRLLVLHVALLLIALLACVAYEGFRAKSNWYSHGLMSILMTLPLWGAIYAAVKLLVRTWRQLGPADPIELTILGRTQARAQVPGLWAWIDQLAMRADAPRPDHIVVGLTDCFYVTSAPVTTHPENLRLEGRTLYLPLPYVSVLSREETAAIVGHELGHFAHNDTDHGVHLGMITRRMMHRIDRLIEQDIADDSWINRPALWASLYFYEAFEAATLHWSRVKEFAADGVGARVAGARTCAQSLLRVTAIADAIDSMQHEHDGNPIGALQSRLRERGLAIATDTLDHVIVHPIDTHPPTRLRIDALEVGIDDALIAQAQRPPSEHDTIWFTQMLAPRAS